METEKQNSLIPIEEALEKVLDLVPAPHCKPIPVENSFGYSLADDLYSPLNLPIFDNAAMDGYCVRHQDLLKATDKNPILLECIGEVQAGSSPDKELTKNKCIRIFTGAAIPRNTTAVVMQEECMVNEGVVRFTSQPKPWEFIRFEGEDVSKGTKIFHKGKSLNARSIAILRSIGCSEVVVAEKPKVAIISTGDELATPGEERKPGQIFESNRHMLASMVQSIGGIPILYPIPKDSINETKDILKKAADETHLLLSTGGISVGKYDLISDAWKEIGGTWITSRINMKPGKPFSLGSLSSSILLALPGNPVSAAMTFTIFVYPAIKKLNGSYDYEPETKMAIAGADIVSKHSRVEFQRVRTNSKKQIVPLIQQGSHCLSTLAQSDGFIRVNPDDKIHAGQEVEFTPWPY